MRYIMWSVVEGALDVDGEFSTQEERDRYAQQLAKEYTADGITSAQIFIANVTPGCAVGEWADEYAVLYWSSEEGGDDREGC